MDKLICGAKARSNQFLPCRLKPMPNGRCRFHGGKTPTKNGRYTNAAYLEKKKLREFIRLSARNCKDVTD